LPESPTDKSEIVAGGARNPLLATAQNVPEPHIPVSLPEQPLVVLEPSKSWVALGLKDVWTYRELFYFLTWRDVKVRYKQTLLGAAWAILQPLCQMIIFTVLFSRVAGIESDGIPYPIFSYAALLPWTFFSNAVLNSSNSLVGSSNLITKVYFPRMIIPGAAVGAGLVDFAIASLLLVVLMIYYRIALTWNVLVLPLLLLEITLLATGVGMWMSALNVKFRDIRYALPFLVQLWMFASPIIYPSSIIPEKWRWVLVLNPLMGNISGFRSALFGRNFDWYAIAISWVITIVMLVYAAYTFRRMEKTFADVV
jgi:lipopolysaccharide transport system permease protein